ncbi:hypothetical protein [Vibrio europaeus]|uniref:hypothetical protein n=1 Tax=Vibrio europaeus TaxID=300876 RepID=UPI00233F0BC1|nr:hypothetical protein [Vibrio europaeus]MDC5855517.1 hypothetical protein [Vibrio europaeus]
MDIFSYWPSIKSLIFRLKKLFVESEKSNKGRFLVIFINSLLCFAAFTIGSEYLFYRSTQDLKESIGSGSQLEEIRRTKELSSLLELCQQSIEKQHTQAELYCDKAEEAYRTEQAPNKRELDEETEKLFKAKAYPLLRIYNERYLNYLEDRLNNSAQKEPISKKLLTYIASPLGFTLYLLSFLFLLSWPSIMYLLMRKKKVISE